MTLWWRHNESFFLKSVFTAIKAKKLDFYALFDRFNVLAIIYELSETVKKWSCDPSKSGQNDQKWQNFQKSGKLVKWPTIRAGIKFTERLAIVHWSMTSSMTHNESFWPEIDSKSRKWLLTAKFTTFKLITSILT